MAKAPRLGLDRLRRRRQPPSGANLRPHRSGLIEFLAPQQRVKPDPVIRQSAGASFLPVDDAQRIADLGPQLTQLASGDHDLPARGHHILDDQDPPSPDPGTLGQPGRAISLGRLPHERARQSSPLPEHRDHRDAAHLQARQHLGPFRNQRHHRIGKLAQQRRISLELVLIEVLISHPARTQHKAARQPTAITNPASKVCISHDDSIAGPDRRLTTTLFGSF
jgi:hypothetical protein